MKNRLSLIIPLVLLIAGTLFVATPSSVSLRFDPSPDPVADYRIAYGRQSGIYTNSVLTGGALSTTITGLAPQTTYYFVAYAVDGWGHSSVPTAEVAAPSTENHTVRLAKASPTAPAELTVLGSVGRSYRVWATSNLSPPVQWVSLATVTTDSAGIARYTDTNPPATMRFYRTEDVTP